MRNLLFILILLMSISCNTKPTNTLEANKDEDYQVDTLINNEIYFLDSVSEKEFLSVSENEAVFCKCYDNTESEIDDKFNVIRKNSVLFFKLQDGTEKKLINTSGNGYYAPKKYCYKMSYDNINQWLVCGYCGDEHAYSFFIDKKMGTEKMVLSKPVFSPDIRYFVCYRTSWTDSSGIQLFKVSENKEINQLWMKLIDSWGPSEIRWKNNNTIYIKKEKIEHDTINHTYYSEFSYVVMPLDKYL